MERYERSELEIIVFEPGDVITYSDGSNNPTETSQLP